MDGRLRGDGQNNGTEPASRKGQTRQHTAEKSAGAGLTRGSEDFSRRTVLGDEPAVHENDPGTDVPRKGHLMGDNQHVQPALCQIAHDGQHFAHHFGIQRRGRLVKQQDFRIHTQGAGDGGALLLTAG